MKKIGYEATPASSKGGTKKSLIFWRLFPLHPMAKFNFFLRSDGPDFTLVFVKSWLQGPARCKGSNLNFIFFSRFKPRPKGFQACLLDHLFNIYIHNKYLKVHY